MTETPSPSRPALPAARRPERDRRERRAFQRNVPAPRAKEAATSALVVRFPGRGRPGGHGPRRP